MTQKIYEIIEEKDIFSYLKMSKSTFLSQQRTKMSFTDIKI